MATVRGFVVHDELGRVISIARPSRDAKVLVLSGQGQSVLETDIDADSVLELVGGIYWVNLEQQALRVYSTDSH